MIEPRTQLIRGTCECVSPTRNMQLHGSINLFYSRAAGTGRKQVPERLSRVAAGQVERDDLQAPTDPATDLDEPEPEGRELQVRSLQPRQPAADGIQEPVGCRMEQEAELIGPEPVAAQAVGEAAVVEILDTQFGMIPSPDVPAVELLGWIISGRDNESQSQPLPQPFRLGDDASFPPRVTGI